MSFIEHLAELRRRLISSGIAVFAATLICFNFASFLFEWLRRPLNDIMGVSMVVLSPLEMFVTYIKLSVVAGIFASAPWLLLQVWLFVSPGLYRKEKKWVIPFVVLGTLFFLGGGAFAYFIVMPVGFEALVKVVPETVDATYSVERYFSLVIRLLLAFGVVSELPLAMWIVAAAGIVGPRQFSRFRKYWVIVAFALGAFLTPPDPVTQVIMALLLILFFEVGMLGARLLYRKPAS